MGVSCRVQWKLGTDTSAGAKAGALTVVGVLELGGWGQSDLAVQASVAEPVDVLGIGDLKIADALPRSAVADPFRLEQRVERLGQGVVVAVARGSDGGHRARLGQALGVASGDVLDALVAVMGLPSDV
jgi:hypothetical protein